jgi:uncharacterized protein YgiM (DUF1202 family)
MGNAATSIVVSIVIIIGCVGSLAIHEEMKSGHIKNMFYKTNSVSNTITNSQQEKIIKARVISNALNLRPEPTGNNTPVSVLRNGELVRVVEVTNERWLKVVTKNNIEGYIAREYVEFINE